MVLADDLRIITYTDTQTRRLEVISQIVKIIGKKQIPIELLKNQIVIWSHNLEKSSPNYKLKKGRLTNEGKKTRAFEKYISLMKEMKIIHQLGSMVSLTTIGSILFRLIEDKKDDTFDLTLGEKAFYLYIFFSQDSDYFILPIDILIKSNTELLQKDFQNLFKKSILNRLEVKYKHVDKKIGAKIGQRKLTISSNWKNAYSYSEHLLAPRLEWLTDLSIIRRNGKYYDLTDKGRMLHINLLKFKSEEFTISDINSNWLNSSIFHTIRYLFPDSFEFFKTLSIEKKKNLIGDLLEKSTKLFRSGSALRISLIPTYLYTSLQMFSFYNIIVEFNDIKELLDKEFEYNQRRYRLKSSARMNEGYITIKLLT